MTGRGLRTTTTSLAIAEGVGLQHKNVLGLIRQNLEELRELGNIAFETRNSIGAGRHTQYTILNEPQATLLLTFMRNSPVVVRFKVRLVEEFYRMREQLKNTQAPAQLSRMEILHLVTH
ncbi:MAG: Rha family transcriptional regulator [Candidatus Thiodiazotropha taylori]|uniref:Rha family transcriptional regulator n=1 Tax=Candidatus Thiodiazotropha taylori TaxID=2792791 RepID=A0A9E4N359_9GAMM|nr:Rha family transcriptional regulator [Candidatus Thiodiazotropha taylori]MCW4255490.1 Rha family transcriptional regulator [Candidatus Thiodiazotropha taylori]